MFLGDVIGRSGRDAISVHLPMLKEKLKPDVTIINVDNAASGRGVTQKIAQDILALGADCLTGGDHIWDQREMICGVENIADIVRPANMPDTTPGKGVWSKTIAGQKITVIHLCGTVFMKAHFANPFEYADKLLSKHKVGANSHVFVDFHAEATSEKMALGHYLDGRISGLVGSHTHIPTADAQILIKGTAFQADAGMCGDFDSVIGVQKEAPIHNFLLKVPHERMAPAEGEATLCGTLIETDNVTGLAVNIAPIRIGGRLRQEIPEF